VSDRPSISPPTARGFRRLALIACSRGKAANTGASRIVSALRKSTPDHYAAISAFACAAICAKTFSLRLFERELRSVSANCSSTPSSKAFTTVSCT
jgi:hypothetical protein